MMFIGQKIRGDLNEGSGTRVKSSKVEVDGKVIGSINGGLNVLLGICKDDTQKDLEYLVDKVLGLRIFEDENGKMNKSLLDVGGELLVISQFTLYGDCRKVNDLAL